MDKLLFQIEVLKSLGVYTYGGDYIIFDDFKYFKNCCPDPRRWFVTAENNYYTVETTVGNMKAIGIAYDSDLAGDINFIIHEEN